LIWIIRDRAGQCIFCAQPRSNKSTSTIAALRGGLLMNKWTKRAGVAVVVLALGVLALAALGSALGERKRSRQVEVDVAPVPVRADAGHIAQGRYLFTTRGCAECHGADGGGKDVIRDGAMVVVAPNLTGGANSATATYRVVDWVRTLRHGVKPNGTPVLVMPSEDYNRLTDDDVGAVIAYVQQLPPVAGRAAEVALPLPVRLLYGAGAIRDAAEKIDHALAPARPVAVGVTVAHGAYVANACIGCHGAHLSGGKIPGTPPSWPAAANLTPGTGGVMGRLRSGHRPDGSAISNVMPFASLGALNDTDVQALHAFLGTLAPRAFGQR
jgi:mono/diheme cytochrome c family protein